jgi:hypothetical protein
MTIAIVILLALAIAATIAREIVWSQRFKLAVGSYANNLMRVLEENSDLQEAGAHALGAVEYASAELVYARLQIEQLISERREAEANR